MKFDTARDQLPQTNLKAATEIIKGGTAHVAYQGIICAIAEAMDRAAGGKDTYIIVGLTSDRSAMLLTVKEGSSKARAGGASLLEVSADAERLL